MNSVSNIASAGRAASCPALARLDILRGESMTYYESAEGETITKARALAEVARHHCDCAEFLADMGDCEQYDAQAVLDWLGY